MHNSLRKQAGLVWSEAMLPYTFHRHDDSTDCVKAKMDNPVTTVPEPTYFEVIWRYSHACDKLMPDYR